MTDKIDALGDKIDRLEARLDGLASTTTTIADRMDVLAQECHRTATQVQRLGLNQEAAKLAGQRRDKSLDAIAEAIAVLNGAVASGQK